MRITGRQLRRIIQEELVREGIAGDIARSGVIDTIASDMNTRYDLARQVVSRLISAGGGSKGALGISPSMSGTDEEGLVRAIQMIPSFGVLLMVDEIFRKGSPRMGVEGVGVLGFVNAELDPLLGDAVYLDAVEQHLNSLLAKIPAMQDVGYLFSVVDGTLYLSNPDGTMGEVLPGLDELGSYLGDI